jgi:hypothetical protein
MTHNLAKITFAWPFILCKPQGFNQTLNQNNVVETRAANSHGFTVWHTLLPHFFETRSFLSKLPDDSAVERH